MSEKPPSLRERQAQLTREEILRAARRLFAERGYAKTSVRDVAQEAGVSAQTVYDSVGSKQELVARLNDLIDVEAGIGPIVGAAAQSENPREVAATPARIMRSMLENCGDILHAVITGAAAEPELAAVLAEGNRRHRDGAGRIAGKLRGMGALKPGLGAEEAADTLAALSDSRFALMLRDAYGWPLDRVESWIADTSRTLLLAEDEGAPH